MGKKPPADPTPPGRRNPVTPGRRPRKPRETPESRAEMAALRKSLEGRLLRLMELIRLKSEPAPPMAPATAPRAEPTPEPDAAGPRIGLS